jgi:hypothetical protein
LYHALLYRQLPRVDTWGGLCELPERPARGPSSQAATPISSSVK